MVGRPEFPPLLLLSATLEVARPPPPIPCRNGWVKDHLSIKVFYTAEPPELYT